MKIQEKIAAKEVSFALSKKKKKWIVQQYLQITIFWTPLIVQASASLKGTFLSISKSGEDSSIAQEDETVENPKKRTKIGGAICNAAASCNSKSNYKNDSTKTFFFKNITSFCQSLQENQ